MSRGIYKIFTYSLSCHHLCLFQGFSGTECVADFVAHGEIGVVDRVEGDWFQFFRVDLSVGQNALGLRRRSRSRRPECRCQSFSLCTPVPSEALIEICDYTPCSIHGIRVAIFVVCCNNQNRKWIHVWFCSKIFSANFLNRLIFSSYHAIPRRPRWMRRFPRRGNSSFCTSPPYPAGRSE